MKDRFKSGGVHHMIASRNSSQKARLAFIFLYSGFLGVPEIGTAKFW